MHAPSRDVLVVGHTNVDRSSGSANFRRPTEPSPFSSSGSLSAARQRTSPDPPLRGEFQPDSSRGSVTTFQWHSIVSWNPRALTSEDSRPFLERSLPCAL